MTAMRPPAQIGGDISVRVWRYYQSESPHTIIGGASELGMRGISWPRTKKV